MTRRSEMSRRKALSMTARGMGASTVLAAGFPAIVPASVFGATAPSNRINVGRDRQRPHLADARHAGRLAVRHRPDRRRLRPRPPEGRGREGPRERLLLEEDGQALRRRHDLPGLQGAAPEQGRGRRAHQHPGPLARAARDRRRRGRQGRLPPEAGLAHHRRGPGPQRRGPPHRAHLPDRQPAALRAAVPLRGRARPQRAHRPAEDGDHRPSRRPLGRRGARDAGPEEPRLRDVAGLDPPRLLHREARPPAGGLRPPGLAPLRAVRRRHDHGLGRPPRRLRPLGDGDGAHRARRDLRLGGVPEERACGTCTAPSRPRPCTRTG